MALQFNDILLRGLGGGIREVGRCGLRVGHSGGHPGVGKVGGLVDSVWS